MRTVLLVLLLLFPLTAIAGDKSYKEIETYTTDKAPRPYIVMGQTAEKARSDEACVRQMAKKAAKKKGDALINVENKPTGAKGMWFGESVLHCTAIVVRWAQAGEKGLSSLDPNTPVPFLLK